MDNGKYVIDKGTLLQKAYYLMCLFFANKEIARRSNPDSPDALKKFDDKFFVSEVSRLLIEIATGIRVLHDQMRKLDQQDKERLAFETRKIAANQYEYALFDDLNLDLKEACNKIIHSDVFEPHSSSGIEAHEYDVAFAHGMGEKTIDWEYRNGYVRLSGFKGNKEWHVLLNIENFVTGVYTLLNTES